MDFSSRPLDTSKLAKAKTKSDNINDDLESLRYLYDAILDLKYQIATQAQERLAHYQDLYPGGSPTVSAYNLAHYLTLRQQDLTQLQQLLARYGLSSLGRSGAHVMKTLDRLLNILSQLTGQVEKVKHHPNYPGYREGQKLLTQNIHQLFGTPHRHRRSYIMVTMPTEAATNTTLVKSLLLNGMDCARINCAHDDAQVWLQIIEQIKTCSTELDQQCKILMDLAGHKIRTGSMAPGPAVKHLKIKRDRQGQLIAPHKVLLYPQGSAYYQPSNKKYQTALEVSPQLHAQIEKDDRIYFTDTIERKRHLRVIEKKDDCIYCVIERGAYISSGNQIILKRQDTHGLWQTIDGLHHIAPFIGEPQEIYLNLHDYLILTKDHLPGMSAKYNGATENDYIAHISCTKPSVLDDLKPGQHVLLDDGKFSCVVAEQLDKSVKLKVTGVKPGGAKLKADKGINLPDTDLNLPALSDKDIVDLDFVAEHADLSGFSFVQTLNDMQDLHQHLQKRAASDTPIIAKIETPKAVKNLPDMLLGSIGSMNVGVMIARGDLAIELGSLNFAETQDELLWLCEAAHVPVIWATQVLESMAKTSLISRPEITDAVMGQRADCVMLNKGPYIVEALQTLDKILRRMKPHHKKGTHLLSHCPW